MAYPPPVAGTEARLLAMADSRSVSRITVAEAREVLGRAGPQVLSRMARKGLIDRVARGVYTIRPPRAAGRIWSTSAFVAVSQGLGPTAHYIGGPAALTVHRLTTQSYSSVVDVFLASERRSRTLASALVRYHRVPPEQLQLGVSPLLVENLEVAMSGPERTVLDALQHPAAFGGVASGVRIARDSLALIDADVLVDFALQLARPTTLQRLGLLLERTAAPASAVNRLAARVRDTTNKPALLPGSRRGPYNPRWHLIENDRGCG